VERKNNSGFAERKGQMRRVGSPEKKGNPDSRRKEEIIAERK
jgi:hypothetical protein